MIFSAVQLDFNIFLNYKFIYEKAELTL
jgi:hypothetical protein